MFFNEDQQYLTDFVTPGNLAATGYKDVQVPLNVFNPLLCFRGGSASLVAQCGGLYELRYSLVAQFLPTVPFEVFVGKIVGDAVTPIEETLETVGNSLFGLAAEEEYALEEIAPEEAVLAGPAQARVPFPPILLPRFISKTAQVCLAAGAQIGLFVRLQNIGVLNVLPGAMLSAQRVGA